MSTYLLLLVALAIILLGAEVFTNGIEWFGRKLNLSDGAVGSVLAAVGTALPETMIPIIAIVFGSKEAGHEIGIGAILGAPFMLATLAFFIAGVTTLLNRSKRPDFPIMNVDITVLKRDQEFFLIVYSIAILSAFLGSHILKLVVAVGLVLAYAVYVLQVLRSEGANSCNIDEMSPCYFAKKSEDPHLAIIIIQVAFALLLIVLGADIFVNKIQIISNQLGLSPFIMSLIIAPIATELPEKFNSIIWILKGKDTLAIGNITGAMVFQSSIIPAIGILLTEWKLTQGAMISAALAILSAGAIYIQVRYQKKLTPYTLIFGGAFYLIFILAILKGYV